MHLGPSGTCSLYVFNNDMEAQVNMRRCVTNGLEKETIVNLQWVLNLVEMFLRTDEYMRIKTFSAFEWQAPKVDCRCVTLWLPFYLGDNMGAE